MVNHLMMNNKPVGSVKVFDPSPLNWLFVLFHIIEEAVRADPLGRIVPSLANDYKWLNENTLEIDLTQDVFFQNNETFTSEHVVKAFHEENRWKAPHPPGTWLNLPEGTTVEQKDLYTVRFHFPKPDGLALGKLRGHHWTNMLFWKKLGFGYRKLGTGEGHW